MERYLGMQATMDDKNNLREKNQGYLYLKWQEDLI
jgi:hypothetical protein